MSKDFAINREYNKNYKVITKDMFWDFIEKKYPKTFKIFGDWIDDYKKENNWLTLFNDSQLFISDVQTIAPKFHELPTAMQFGIIIQFAQESMGSPPFKPFVDNMENFGTSIDEWFDEYEILINENG